MHVAIDTDLYMRRRKGQKLVNFTTEEGGRTFGRKRFICGSCSTRLDTHSGHHMRRSNISGIGIASVTMELYDIATHITHIWRRRRRHCSIMCPNHNYSLLQSSVSLSPTNMKKSNTLTFSSFQIPSYSSHITSRVQKEDKAKEMIQQKLNTSSSYYSLISYAVESKAVKQLTPHRSILQYWIVELW